MSYWIYQHLGNLSPDEIRAEGMLDAVLGEPTAARPARRGRTRAEETRRRPGATGSACA